MAPKNLSDVPIEIFPNILNCMDQATLLRIGATCRFLNAEIRNSQKYFDTLVLTASKRKYTLSIQYCFEIRFQEIGKFKTRIEYGKDSTSTTSRKIHFQPIHEAVIEILANFLARIGKRLKQIHIFVDNGLRSKIVRQISLKNLPNLKRFEIEGKSTSQLDIFKYHFIDEASLSKVEIALKIPNTKLSLERLVSFQSKAIEVSLMPNGLTKDNLREFIEKWLNGHLHATFRKLKIVMSRRTEIGNLNLSGLNVRVDQNGIGMIQSRIDATKYLGIAQYSNYYIMQVYIEENGEFKVENDIWI